MAGNLIRLYPQSAYWLIVQSLRPLPSHSVKSRCRYVLLFKSSKDLIAPPFAITSRNHRSPTRRTPMNTMLRPTISPSIRLKSSEPAYTSSVRNLVFKVIQDLIAQFNKLALVKRPSQLPVVATLLCYVLL